MKRKRNDTPRDLRIRGIARPPMPPPSTRMKDKRKADSKKACRGKI